MNSQSQSEKILSSWKEIATCLNRGVRTVQRWEHEGLPIRRPAGARTNVVIAVESDLRAWLEQWQKKGSASSKDREIEQYAQRFAAVKQQIEQISIRLRELEERLEDLRPTRTEGDESEARLQQAS